MEVPNRPITPSPAEKVVVDPTFTKPPVGSSPNKNIQDANNKRARTAGHTRAPQVNLPGKNEIKHSAGPAAAAWKDALDEMMRAAQLKHKVINKMANTMD